MTDVSRQADRRANQRRRLAGPVKLDIPGAQPMTGRALNIGVGGIAVIISMNMAAVPRCTVTFTLRFRDGSARTLEVAASGAHSVYSAEHEGFVMGFHFTSLAPEESEAVRRYVDE